MHSVQVLSQCTQKGVQVLCNTVGLLVFFHIKKMCQVQVAFIECILAASIAY